MNFDEYEYSFCMPMSYLVDSSSEITLAEFLSTYLPTTRYVPSSELPIYIDSEFSRLLINPHQEIE